MLRIRGAHQDDPGRFVLIPEPFPEAGALEGRRTRRRPGRSRVRASSFERRCYLSALYVYLYFSDLIFTVPFFQVCEIL